MHHPTRLVQVLLAMEVPVRGGDLRPRTVDVDGTEMIGTSADFSWRHKHKWNGFLELSFGQVFFLN